MRIEKLRVIVNLCGRLMLMSATALLGAGCSKNKEGANYQQVGAEELGMKAAVEKAGATTNDFVVAFRAQKPGTKIFI